MKRFAILLILAIAIFEPVELKPVEPIEVKPVLTTAIKPPWTINKTIVAYYQKVKMPDGSRVELKSKTPLDEKGWAALADKQWTAMKAADEAEKNTPENCFDCHSKCRRAIP